MNSFSPEQIIKSAEINANFNGLADGTEIEANVLNHANQIDMSYVPFGQMTYSVFGSGGGQVVPVTTETILAFETLETNNGTTVTKSANGTMQVSQAGYYHLKVNVGVVDVNHTMLLKFAYYNGSSWNDVTEWTANRAVTVNRSNEHSAYIYLAEDYQVRSVIYAYTQTRVGADSSASKTEASFTLVRVA